VKSAPSHFQFKPFDTDFTGDIPDFAPNDTTLMRCFRSKDLV
jgi:hypothetical protein